MNGVRIFLELGTRIPKWIRNQTLNTEVIKKVIKGRNIQVLTIKKGRASFGPGGGVGVVMPGSDQWWGAFREHEVLQIENIKDKTIKPNYHLCPECFTNTGRMVDHKRSDRIAGREDATFKCAGCNSMYILEAI